MRASADGSSGVLPKEHGISLSLAGQRSRLRAGSSTGRVVCAAPSPASGISLSLLSRFFRTGTPIDSRKALTLEQTLGQARPRPPARPDPDPDPDCDPRPSPNATVGIHLPRYAPLPRLPGHPHAPTEAARREQKLSPPLPSALGEQAKGVAFPFRTHPPPPPLRSGARNSALAEPHTPGYLRVRRTRAEEGSAERFLGRLRSSGRAPRGPPRRLVLPPALRLRVRSCCGTLPRGELDSLSHWFV